MPLSAGDRLGPYEILALIDAGPSSAPLTVVVNWQAGLGK